MHACSQKMTSVPYICTTCLFILKVFQLHILNSFSEHSTTKSSTEEGKKQSKKKQIYMFPHLNLKTVHKCFLCPCITQISMLHFVALLGMRALKNMAYLQQKLRNVIYIYGSKTYSRAFTTNRN